MKKSITSSVIELQNLFPTVGGVGPGKLFPRDLEREMRRINRSETIDSKWFTSIINVVKSASDVGLIVTVNDIGRVIRESLETNSARPFPSIYKGVSYNPQTYGNGREKGEWIVLLDFFAILRSIANLDTMNPPRFFVLDAGLYWVANLLGNALAPVAQSSDAAAQQIIQKLAQAIKESRFREVIMTNRIRNAYLRAISDVFPANRTPPVISLKDVWFDPEFVPFLSKALLVFCRKDGKNLWSVASPVAYERYMPYSPWVTPLVAAETIFIGEKQKYGAFYRPPPKRRGIKSTIS